MIWKISSLKTASSDLDFIPEGIWKEILQDINILSTNPFLSGSNVKKLRGFKPLPLSLKNLEFN